MGTHGDARSIAVGPGGRRPANAAPAVAFFVGLVLTLGALGTAAALVGRMLTRWSPAFALGAAALTLAAGIATVLAPALRRRVPDPEIRQRRSVAGAFVYGVLYSVATITTSAGPLVLLLTIAAAMGRPAYGAAISLAYGVGRGLPFLMLGLFAGRLSSWIERIEPARRAIEIVSGIALIALSAYFVWLATLVK